MYSYLELLSTPQWSEVKRDKYAKYTKHAKYGGIQENP